MLHLLEWLTELQELVGRDTVEIFWRTTFACYRHGMSPEGAASWLVVE